MCFFPSEAQFLGEPWRQLCPAHLWTAHFCSSACRGVLAQSLLKMRTAAPYRTEAISDTACASPRRLLSPWARYTIACGAVLLKACVLWHVACAGLLYLLSCLAKYDDMRAELEAAGAVDVLLELLGSRHDTKVQARSCTISVAALTDACGASTADEGA